MVSEDSVIWTVLVCEETNVQLRDIWAQSGCEGPAGFCMVDGSYTETCHDYLLFLRQRNVDFSIYGEENSPRAEQQCKDMLAKMLLRKKGQKKKPKRASFSSRGVLTLPLERV